MASPDDAAGATPEDDGSLNSGLLPQVMMMLRALVGSPVFPPILALGAGLFVVVAGTAYEQIRLNSWNQPFYNALSNRDWYVFRDQLVVFAEIACILLVLNVAQRWLGEMTKVKLREGLVRDLVKEWLEPRRAFTLANAGPIGVNPDQRMHEDARHLTELSTDLGVGLLQSTILLASFVSVLWALSAGFVFHIQGRSIVLPGYMVWAAVAYAGSASLLTYWSGRRLVDQNAARYAREAELRFTLMQANEHMDAIALSRGEADVTERIDSDLDSVLAAMRGLVGSLTRLTWVTAGYGWFTLVAPILVAAPVYFAGDLSFGGLMMAVGAFNQVQTSLRWFVDNFSVIADWRATLLRVASFRAATIAADGMHRSESHIQYVESPAGTAVFENLEISSPSGGARLADARVEIRAGERVVFVGDPGTNKETLFRALAELWPWGSGRVGWPKGAEVAFLPETPYLPRGTLRDILAYPSKPDSIEDAAYKQALTRMGLDRLAASLNQVRRWEHELDLDERYALTFARALLHKTDWVVIGETLGFMEKDMLDRVVAVLEEDLKQAGVLYVGGGDVAERLGARVCRLEPDPRVKLLRRGAMVATSANTKVRLPESV
jgi:putative ATP-binding cassette transporter